MIKTIRHYQTDQRFLHELQPGMIAPEGVILELDPRRGQYTTVLGPVQVEERHQVLIIGKVSPIVLEGIQEAVAEREAQQRRRKNES